MKDKKHGHRDDEIDASDITNPDVHHEVSDVRVRPILLFGAGLLVSTAVIYLLMGWLFDSFEEREKKAGGKQSPLAGERQKIPPEPRLYLSPRNSNQLSVDIPRPNIMAEHPFQELKKLRAEEEEKLSHYNWVDQNAGVVTIPIEEAKRLVLQRGLLVSRQGAAAAREEQPSDASSGLKQEKKNQ